MSRLYEDFQPPSDWDHDKESDTLILMLPGFRKEQLRVQTTSSRKLRVSGERKISDNKWRRFHNEYPISESNDTSGISAKFEAGMLYVKIPKLLTPPTPQPPKPTTEPKPDPEPADVDKTSEPKPEPETPPLQEPKAEEKDSQEKTETDGDNNKTYDKVEETHGSTAQTAFQEQKEDHEDSEKESKKEKEKVETEGKEVIAETMTSEAKEMNEITKDDKFGMKSVIVKIKKRYSSTLNMFYGLVEEAKKQNKLANLMVAIFLVLLIGLYIKNILVKSSFGGTRGKSQEF